MWYQYANAEMYIIVGDTTIIRMIISFKGVCFSISVSSSLGTLGALFVRSGR